MQGGKIDTKLDMGVVCPVGSNEDDAIFSYLLQTGYLTLRDAPAETEIGTIVSLGIPNQESLSICKTLIPNWSDIKNDEF